MMKLLVEELESQPTRADVHLKQTTCIGELDTFYKSAGSILDELSKKVIELNVTVKADLMDLKKEQLQNKLLKKRWNDSKGCIADDRCVAKVEVLLKIILKIKAQFSGERRKSSMTSSENQIHMCEKNRLRDHCTRIQSLFNNHCLCGAIDQFAHFQSWFKMARDVLQNCETFEKKLMSLAERLEEFVDKLNTICVQYSEKIQKAERLFKKTRNQDVVKELELIPVTPSLTSQDNSLNENIATGTSASQFTGDISHQNNTFQGPQVPTTCNEWDATVGLSRKRSECTPSTRPSYLGKRKAASAEENDMLSKTKHFESSDSESERE